MYWHRVAEGSDKEFLRRLIYIARKDSIEPKLCINKIMQIPLKAPRLGKKVDYVKFNETAEEAERILEILSRAESDIGKARTIVAGYMARDVTTQISKGVIKNSEWFQGSPVIGGF